MAETTKPASKGFGVFDQLAGMSSPMGLMDSMLDGSSTAVSGVTNGDVVLTQDSIFTVGTPNPRTADSNQRLVYAGLAVSAVLVAYYVWS